MSASRLFSQISDHLYQNRRKYVFLISVAAVMLVEAAKKGVINTSNTRTIETPEGTFEVMDWRSGFEGVKFDKDLSENCAEFAFYRDLCALTNGFKYSMTMNSNFEMAQSDNRMELVEAGKSAVCAVARFFAAKMGVAETEACNQLPNVGFKFK